MKKSLALLLILGAFAAFSFQFQGEGQSSINPSDFVDTIDNPYFALKPTTHWVHEGIGDDGFEHEEFTVTTETKEILGVTTTVVLEIDYVESNLDEIARTFYAQDKDGNVWIFGKSASEYEDGTIVTDESWESGVDGAKPGIFMVAHPQVGDVMQQGIAPGVNEDVAEVVGVNESISILFGDFDNALKIRQTSPLEPDEVDYQYYVPGLGFVLEEEMAVGGELERFEMVKRSVKFSSP